MDITGTNVFELEISRTFIYSCLNFLQAFEQTIQEWMDQVKFVECSL